MDKIKRLWEEYRKAPYPSEGHVDGLDLELLDGDIAGCITTFIHQDGQLDVERINILKKCLSELEDDIEKIPESAQSHFFRLINIGDRVIIELKMEDKVICPTCGREFSEHIVNFPMFIDDNDETMVYYKCPLCALEARGEPFTREHSKKLYEEALKEIEETGQQNKKKSVDQKDIKWEKLVRLTPEENDKVKKMHPELFKGK